MMSEHHKTDLMLYRDRPTPWSSREEIHLNMTVVHPRVVLFGWYWSAAKQFSCFLVCVIMLHWERLTFSWNSREEINLDMKAVHPLISSFSLKRDALEHVQCKVIVQVLTKNKPNVILNTSAYLV